MRIRVWSWAVAMVVAVATAMPARAQLGVYGQFTGVSTGLANTPKLYGGTFGVYMGAHMGLISLGPDFRGTLTHHSASGSSPDQAMDLGLAGLRLAVSPLVLPVKPYVEALGGIGYHRTGQGSSRQDKYSAAAQFLAGVDFTVLPRIDWRVIEFSYGRVGGSVGVINPETLSTGVVLRLP